MTETEILNFFKSNINNSNWSKNQMEITPKSQSELLNYLDLAGKLNISKVNLTEKKGNHSISNSLRILSSELADIKPSITATFSIKHHYNQGSLPQITNEFLAFWGECKLYNVSELLIVSGSGKRSVNTLDLLKIIDELGLFNKSLSYNPTISVAYNPYLEYAELEREENRIVEKLNFDFVKKVYLQIGIELEITKKAISNLRNRNANLEIINCVLLPDKYFIKNFIFRPWKGVKLSEEYLNNLESAIQTSSEIFKFNQSQKVLSLITLFCHKWI
jgi:hypothetical protein